MHDPKILPYLERRERDERAMAESAYDPSARSAHLAMARRYRSRITDARTA